MTDLQTLFTYLKDKTGSIAPLTAVMLPLLLGFTGVGIDVGYWMHNQRNLQAAADAAVISAGYEIGNNLSEAEASATALRQAINNGYQDTADNNFTISFSQDDDANDLISVSIRSAGETYFSKVLYQGDIVNEVRAMSRVTIQPTDFCLLSLNEAADGALTAVGAVDIISQGCGIAVNSNSDSALDLSGNVDIDIGDLSIVGDMDVSGSVDLSTSSTRTGARTADDPYEDVSAPDFESPDDCDYTNLTINGDQDPVPHTDNTGDGKVVYCGGIQIGGNGDVVFDAGVYYLYAGDLRVTGNGEIDATAGVTIVLTGSEDDGYGNLDVAGGKDMFFTAPVDGALSGDEEQFEGMAFFQDRNAPNDGSCNNLTGNSALDLIGAAYFPSRCLDIGGNSDDNSSQAEVCSRIIANTIRLHGNPHLGNDCDGVDIPETGYMVVRLIQ